MNGKGSNYCGCDNNGAQKPTSLTQPNKPFPPITGTATKLPAPSKPNG